MNKEILDAIQKQINLEAYSAYVYLAMAAYFDNISLDGCASWMKLQAKEELSHMMKFYDYVVSQNEEVEFQLIKKPVKSWDTPLSAFKTALEHEKKVSAAIHKIMDLSIAHNDHRTRQFLMWFIEEQVEEEQEVQSIIDKIALIREERSSILIIDKALMKRSD